jgi:dimethylhistidine N-methyltransferase
MCTQASVALNPESALESFASDIRRGLGRSGQKFIPSTYLYDAIGSALFDVITLLPEYGLTRADEALLRKHSAEIASRCGDNVFVVELGSGSGSKTRALLQALGSGSTPYYPIDVSRSALDRCVGELDRFAQVKPIEGSYLEGLHRVLNEREPGTRMLLLFLGSTIGNFDKPGAVTFLKQTASAMARGDHLLIGADLVKPMSKMLPAYDDATGVTAAFNLNLLARINRELGADFDLRAFRPEVRWNEDEQRIEMHLRSQYRHAVKIPGARIEVHFRSGETIWTESSHKFTIAGLEALAEASGFRHETCWVDEGWPFAECLWAV